MELSEVLVLDRPVYAHTGSRFYKAKETLQEHTQRCRKYFACLAGKEKIQEALAFMEPVLTGGLKDEFREWFWEALNGVIAFHDAGKVNPVFQMEAMENAAYSGIKIPELRDRNHSLLSAYIYLDSFAEQL